MNIKNEIYGGEFDWFAQDNQGNIAIFATAGEAKVPRLVAEDYKNHNSISELIESPKWGTAHVWDDYANLGLYVFDWKLHKGPYLREATPNNLIAQDLKNKIHSLKSLISFNFRFTDKEILEESDINI